MRRSVIAFDLGIPEERIPFLNEVLDRDLLRHDHPAKSSQPPQPRAGLAREPNNASCIAVGREWRVLRGRPSRMTGRGTHAALPRPFPPRAGVAPTKVGDSFAAHRVHHLI